MENEIKLPIWVCERCGSNRLEQLAWVWLNTSEPEIDFVDSNDEQNYWCRDCELHVKIKIREDG